ncbi:Dyp-type peroxidase [Streptomyces sp. NPDC051576]|uniref:Dyp-type peroxidase n=1 Tax=Streptomyces sp. NPDC051576 TaxID=3155803 RepID=UPI003443FE7B
MTTSRRGLLRASVAAAAVGTGGITAAGIVASGNNPAHQNQMPSPLRGSAPLQYAQIAALDLISRSHRGDSLHAAHHVIKTMDGGKIAAWLALGESALPASTLRPQHLRQMPAFPGDLLDPAQSHGDLLLQITGTSPKAVQSAIAQALRELPQWRIRWRIDGMRPENRTEDGRGLARNPFHFTEGYGNPATPSGVEERATVTAAQGEPPWAVGGSYQVIRIIRLATDFWDRDTIHEQERIIGRRRNGRWLDGTPSTEQPVFAADPHGRTTPLDAHVRRAAPDRRNPPPLVRRGYNYDHGNGDTGLIFSCFQRDLEKGFEAVQRRLQGEAMAKYALTVGGGYFFVPPPGNAWIDAVGAK